MNQFNPLKYRGVFDYPTIQTRNLLAPRKYKAVRYDPRITDDLGGTINDKSLGVWAEPVEPPAAGSANPPNTSGHILEFLGWSGGAKGTGRRKPTYLGTPSAGRVLDQREAWIENWLQKGRYEHEKEQLRIAAQQGRKENAGVSAKKSA